MNSSAYPLHYLALILIFAGCGSDGGGGLGIYNLQGDTSSEPVDPGGTTTEASGVDGWRPPGVALGCGSPCTNSERADRGVCLLGVATRCVDGVVVCDECAASGRTCLEDPDAGALCRRDCEGTEICPPGEECFTQVCCPSTRWCERGAMAICDTLGTAVSRTPCLEGLDCNAGQCVPAESFVHVLFDTSGSMNWTPTGQDTPADVQVFPACDDPDSPHSRLGVSKKAFHSLFADDEYGGVLFALQRFPQRLFPNIQPRCPGGAYEPKNVITGGEGVWYAAADWFERNLSEVLVVPFPRTAFEANRELLRQWLDFDEELRVTDEPCSQHTHCPGGLCTIPGGDGVCRYFDNPELRAPSSATPLGISLFYAGEYIRTQVVVDGKECLLDADCGVPHVICESGRCRDPNRFCRQRSVVVFSDGVDTVAAVDWYDPVVQARRFRAGLGCTSASDCGPGFQCLQSTCQPAGAETGNACKAIAGHSCGLDTRSVPEAAGKGSPRVLDRNGVPIDITVHVIDGSGAGLAASVPIAAYGGGLWVAAQLADPTALLEAIRPVVNWKDTTFCSGQ